MNDINELETEKIISIIFIILSIIEIYGNELEQVYIKTNNKELDILANNIFIFTIIITLIIYLYFLYINILDYNREDNKELYGINVISTLLLIIGTILQLYFQINSNDSFIGEPD